MTKRYLIHLWSPLLLLAAFHIRGPNNSVTPQKTYPECIEQVIGSGEVVKSEELDVDNKDGLDQVILYKTDRLLHILLALNPVSENCNIIFNEYLTNLALVNGQQTVEIREIEMIELTGDAQPEIYVWINKIGGGRFVSASVHTIYAANAGNWKETLHIEQCLAFSSFNFRDTPVENTKDIYRDTDIVCNPPFSTSRSYDIFRWNGYEFVSIENGTVTVWSLYPPIWYSVCIIASAGMVLTITLIIINFRKRHQLNIEHLR